MLQYEFGFLLLLSDALLYRHIPLAEEISLRRWPYLVGFYS
jgi:hypothetical protein